MIAASTASHLADGYLPARQRSYDKFEQEEETDVEQDWPAETEQAEEIAEAGDDPSSLDDIESKKGGGGQDLGSSSSFPGLSHAEDHHDGISRGGPWGRVESLKAVRAEDAGLSAMEGAEAAEGLETESWTKENSDGKTAGQGSDWQTEGKGGRSDALLQTGIKSSDDESTGPETFDASSIRANNDKRRQPAEVMKVLEARYGDERAGERGHQLESSAEESEHAGREGWGGSGESDDARFGRLRQELRPRHGLGKSDSVDRFPQLEGERGHDGAGSGRQVAQNVAGSTDVPEHLRAPSLLPQRRQVSVSSLPPAELHGASEEVSLAPVGQERHADDRYHDTFDSRTRARFVYLLSQQAHTHTHTCMHAYMHTLMQGRRQRIVHRASSPQILFIHRRRCPSSSPLLPQPHRAADAATTTTEYRFYECGRRVAGGSELSRHEGVGREFGRGDAGLHRFPAKCD